MSGLPALLTEALPGGAAAFVLTLARAGGFVVALPGLGEEPVPVRVRLLLAATLSAAMLAGGLIPPTEASPALLLGELALGLALGALVRIIAAAAALFGSIAAMQTGLASATIFDPAQTGPATLVTRFAALAAAATLLAADLHLVLIAGFARSYAAFPVGGLPDADFAPAAVAAAGSAMRAGVELAGPLIAYGLLFNLALGLASRAAPAIQIFFIAQPLQLIGGLALLAATLGATLAAYGARVEAALRALLG